MDEQSHRPIGPVPGVHSTKQHRPEPHLRPTARARDHLAPREVTKARHAHTQTTRLTTKTIAQCARQIAPCFLDPTAVAMHFMQPKRSRRLVDVAEQAPEERLVL